MRTLIYALGSGLALCAAGGIYIAESATHIYESLRWLPARSVAEAVAAHAGARLEDAEIVASDGSKLRAWIYAPEQANGTAVVALHGVGGHRGHMLGHAGLLARHGFTVITPDSRAHGVSEGAYLSYGVLETGDVSRWIDTALARPGIRRVAGLGESMGAAILLQTAGRDPRLAGVIAESPFVTFDQVARDRVEQRASLLAWPVLEPGFLYLRARRGIDLREASPLAGLRAAMNRQPAPRVILIHSPADRNIPVWHSRQLREVDPARIDLWEPANVAHTQALGTLPGQFEQRVTAFLNALP